MIDNNIKPYKQKGNTCAIARLLMILKHYKIIEKISWQEERRLYRVYHCNYMEGVPFSAIAFHLSKKGLNVTLCHSEKGMFKNEGVLKSESFENAMDEYKAYLKNAELKGTKVINGAEINAELLKELLISGNIIMLAGHVGEAFHAILLSGYNDNQFIVCDPLQKNII